MDTQKMRTLPLIATRGIIALPNNELKIDIGRDVSVQAVKLALEQYEGYVILSSQKDPLVDNVIPADIYEYGVIGRIKMSTVIQNDGIRISVEVLSRVRIDKYLEETNVFVVNGEELTDIEIDNNEEMALLRQGIAALESYIQTGAKPTQYLLDLVSRGHTAGQLADVIAFHLPMPIERKQKYVETLAVNERLLMIIKDIHAEIEVAQLEEKIERDVREAFDQSQKEYYLREKLRAIREELGDKNSREKDSDMLREEIEALDAPDYIREKLLDELTRFEMVPAASSESGIIRTYIDWVLSLPWGTFTPDEFEIKEAKDILDADHYGLQKVKERILEFLAVKKLTGSNKGAILCLVGPPGVGKTSLVRSVARALNRNYVKIALGGVRDEAEIRGHRRTYIGSMPGKVIQSLKKAGSMNPVILLDEIDKMASDFRGDPTSALLEVLDPEQNTAFNDHYIEEPVDLSNVFFIATANYYEGIPHPLYDRMEIIELGSYTEDEKVEIAKNHLIPKTLERHGLTKKQLSFQKTALLKIVREYTREAGVRALERELATICRKVAKELLENPDTVVKITTKNVADYLGKTKFKYSSAEKTNQVGVVTGLAYTQFGGDILSIEVTYYKGREQVVLTGQLGDVMKESAQAAMSYVKSRAKMLGIDEKIFEENTIHIHVPEGAVPKDGPSAGAALATAIISALSNRKVRKDVGMTGEITLRGNILPIGGLKEKSMAAHRSGLKTILIPKENERDLDDIPEVVKEHLTIIPVSHMDEVLPYVFADTK